MWWGDDDAKWPRHVGRITDRERLRKHINGYDTGIRFADDQVGTIVAALKSAGVYDDTAIIISADHGESQGELGIYGEHGTADNATCRIPMIIKWPGGQAGIDDDELHYNVDFAPTLMELLGGKAQPLWDGKSYAGTIKDGAADGWEDVVVSQCAHVCQRSVRWGDYLYVRTYHDGFHLFPSEMLFDLEADPHEQVDLAEKCPELCREGAWRLSRWHEAQMNKIAKVFPNDVSDPLWTVIAEGGPFHALHEARRSPLSHYLKRLEETGRSDAAAALRKKYVESLPKKE